ncbi:hypothetical protein DL771_008800 [Monosporascus sp. 5C6A]|nr:hypothetical protein DL771_008800 [Monosporascus sp. 5C6A]
MRPLSRVRDLFATLLRIVRLRRRADAPAAASGLGAPAAGVRVRGLARPGRVPKHGGREGGPVQRQQVEATHIECRLPRYYGDKSREIFSCSPDQKLKPTGW